MWRDGVSNIVACSLAFLINIKFEVSLVKVYASQVFVKMSFGDYTTQRSVIYDWKTLYLYEHSGMI